MGKLWNSLPWLVARLVLWNTKYRVDAVPSPAPSRWHLSTKADGLQV